MSERIRTSCALLEWARGWALSQFWRIPVFPRELAWGTLQNLLPALKSSCNNNTIRMR